MCRCFALISCEYVSRYRKDSNLKCMFLMLKWSLKPLLFRQADHYFNMALLSLLIRPNCAENKIQRLAQIEPLCLQCAQLDASFRLSCSIIEESQWKEERETREDKRAYFLLKKMACSFRRIPTYSVQALYSSQSR